MILTLKSDTTPQQLQELTDYLTNHRIQHTSIERSHLVVLPKNNAADLAEHFSCIESATHTTQPFPLASLEWKQQTHVAVGEHVIGSDDFSVIAGPCSVENEEQIYAVAEYLHSRGVPYIRGGAYKPRTSPYSFRGLGKKGLILLHQAAKTYNLKVVTEIMDLRLLDELMEYADVLQVGSRNMQNFYMLNELGKLNKPVLLKRGMQAKAKEWLLAAEYLLTGGNQHVVLCERGIRSFDSDMRNVMDIGVIPFVKQLSHLPIIADPSHGTGSSSRVTAMAMAAAAAGADGLMVEIHPTPNLALSDKQQALSFEEFDALLERLNALLPAVHKKAPTQSGVFKLQTL
ncbi:MAG: 3-deoxy-7-phosphoheptulonate synthase [Bacteroidota bacterium]